MELGVLVPYPEEGSEARDQRLPSVLRAGTKEKCAAVLGEKLRGLSSGLVPVCPCRGECGRGSVGEVLDVTIRLFLLLVRQKLPLLGRLSSFSPVRDGADCPKAWLLIRTRLFTSPPPADIPPVAPSPPNPPEGPGQAS